MAGYRVIKRDELFDAIWERPMTDVAREYGISDVALRKICIKMAIPTPSRGYWRRQRQGYAVKKPALPKLPPNLASAITVSLRHRAATEALPTPEPDGLSEALKAARNAQEFHPLVLRAERALKRAKANEKGILQPRAKRVIRLAVSEGGRERALQGANLILHGLEALGNTVRVKAESSPTLRAVVLDEELGLSIEEKLSAHPYQPKPADRRKYPWLLPRYEYVPTGKLTVRVHGNFPQGVRTSWSDGKVQRIETLLEKILCGIYAAAQAQATKREDDAEQERRREEAARRYEEDCRLRRLASQRELHLQKLAGQYEEWLRLERFVNAAEQNLDRLSGIQVQGLAIPAWLEWAKDYVRGVNPFGGLGWWQIDKQVPLWKVPGGWS